jgi:putative nucleotidyltransferase with HDIG domain
MVEQGSPHKLLFVVDAHGLQRNRQLIASLRAPCVTIDDIERADVVEPSAMIFDVDLTSITYAKRLKSILAGGPSPQLRIFAVNYMRRLEMIYANIFGATRILRRPLSEASLMQHLTGGTHPPELESREMEAGLGRSIESAAGALSDLFGAISLGGALNIDSIDEAGDEVVEAITEGGVTSWLETVRTHHESTFQHCLIVTGLITNFAHATGMSRSDTAMLTRAGLMHDVGKASIPVEILDKPSALTAEEMAVVKQHPGLGFEYLTEQEIDPDVLSAVRSHHEYLDGSGYPDGLSGAAIGDIPRILTVCDVFGALIERRSYKAPMPADKAIAVLYDMADKGKVERPLVGALRRAIETH